MEKVKLPKEIGSAIEELRKTGWSEECIVNAIEFIDFEHKPIRPTGAPSTIANWLSEDIKRLLILASAVVNGYELEHTPEEKLSDIYKKYENYALQAWNPVVMERNHLICQGIKIAVDELGFKIEGINA
ncbi:hypothetical protein JNUCC42_21520 [Brevibacterium sp. JNUCC-42]|nr:hypothetical protein JNUCC42_21520 [Brevibacterium sp. JNUCC-42]